MAIDPLVAALEAGRLPAGGFGHAQHVQFAWHYARTYPLPEALERCRTVLQGLAARAGAPGKYHETVTAAYLVLVAERAQQPDAPTEWETFACRYPELFRWKPGILDAYYRPDTLWSEEARRAFLPPDAIANDALSEVWQGLITAPSVAGGRT